MAVLKTEPLQGHHAAGHGEVLYYSEGQERGAVDGTPALLGKRNENHI